MQQLDILADFGTKSYIVGSTNSLLLQQKDRYSDILINLDEDTINVTSTSLKAALQLSVPDRRWIDFITQNVNDTWDEANPGRPKTLGYVGSEEFIRLQFEEYLLSLISSVKYHNHLTKHSNNPRMLLPHIEGDPSLDFSQDFVDAWKRTDNYRIWNTHTDSHLFDIVEPKHPCAGGLTIDDVQRRITQQVQDLHLDERFAVGKEVLGRNLAAGREKASTMFNKLYADMEALREAQRKRAEEVKQQQSNESDRNSGGAQQTMQSVGVKAGAFVNSWAAWAGEKRKAAGWGRSSSAATPNDSQSNSSGGGGWGSGWGKASKNRVSLLGGKSDTVSEKDPKSPGYSPLPTPTTARSDHKSEERPLNRESLTSLSGESLVDAAGSESGMSSPVSPRRRPLSAESTVAAAPPIAIDSVVATTGRVAIGEVKKAGTPNGTSAANAPPVQEPTIRKVIEEEPEDSPPLTPVPVAVAAAEAAEAQGAWGRS